MSRPKLLVKVSNKTAVNLEKHDGEGVPYQADKSRNLTVRSKFDLDHVQEQIRAANEQNLPASAIQTLKLRLRAENPELTAHDIDQLWSAIIDERAQIEENTYLLDKQLPTLLQVQQQRLVLSDYLWGGNGQLATLLDAIATAMPTAPEFLLTTLIAAAGSRIAAGTQIVIKPTARYTQPAIYRTLIVASTGGKKTPAQNIILAPLEDFEGEAFSQWQKAQTAYREALHNYTTRLRKNQDAGECPLPSPPRKRYIVGDSTIEARVRIHQENPRGFLIYRDEGSAHFGHRNKRHHGLNDNLEIELSEFNGGILTRDRKFESSFVAHSAISRTGTIQWEVLAKLMQNHEDVTGEWSRWLFCAAPTPIAKIDLLSPDVDDISSEQMVLKKLYQCLEQVEPQSYQLSHSAKHAFQATQHQLVDWMREEDQPGLKVAYPKFESYLARLALWLHVVNAALDGKQPAFVINEATVSRAGQLTQYFIGQLRLIYAHNSPQEKLTGDLLRMQAFAETKGRPVEAREFKMGIWRLRKLSMSEIRTNLATLVQAGYGHWVDGKYQVNSLTDCSEPS